MTQPETKAQVRDRLADEHFNNEMDVHSDDADLHYKIFSAAWNERDKLAQQEVDALVKALESIAYHEGNKETPNIGVSRNGAIKAYNNNIHVAKQALAKHRGGM